MNVKNNSKLWVEASKKNCERKRMEGAIYSEKDLSKTKNNHGWEEERKQGCRRHSVVMAASALAFLSHPPKSSSPQKNKESSTLQNKTDKNLCMNLPQKLMKILADKRNEEIITWLPHGKAFIIVRKKYFASEILPQYFKKTKFTSFTRKLNRWGFIRVSKGPEAGAYYHKYFLRGDPSLCNHMICESVKNHKKKNSPKELQVSLKKVQHISETCPMRLTPGFILEANARRFFNPTLASASSIGFKSGNDDCIVLRDQPFETKNQKGSMNSTLIQDMNNLRVREEILRVKQSISYMKKKQRVHSAIMKNAADALQLWRNINLKEAKYAPQLSISTPPVTLQQQMDHFTKFGLMDPTLEPAAALHMASRHLTPSSSAMLMGSIIVSKSSRAA